MAKILTKISSFNDVQKSLHQLETLLNDLNKNLGIINSIQTSKIVFKDNDTSLMTSSAIADKIESYNYLTSTLSDEQVQDKVGAMFSSNTETLITATYQDADGTIDLAVDNDLSNYDNSSSGFTTTAGTVTSVGGAGTKNGLTLTGTVTSSGNLTLGGTLAINNGDWSGTALADGNIASASTWNSLVSNATHTGDVTGATSLTIADDVALGGSPTTTTQSAGDDSTKVATTAYVETAVSNLVDSAPGTLNTLNELAAALGDDASFSTTVTNSIATKAPLASPTFTGTVTMPATIARTGDLTLDVSGDITLDADGGDVLIIDSSPGALKPTLQLKSISASNLGPVFHIVAQSSSPANLDTLFYIPIYGKNDADEDVNYMQEWNTIIDVADGSERGQFQKTVMADGALRNGISLTGQTTDTVNVNLGYGAASSTTIAGDLTITGGNITNAITFDSGITNAGTIAAGTWSGTALVAGKVPAHNDLTGFVANEHIDWTTDQGGTNIDSGNYTNTTYSEATGSAEGLMSIAHHDKLDGIASNANNYSHPTGNGNNHIPADGSAGQFLKYSSAGTAVWAADNNTTYSVGDGGLTTNDFTNADHTKLNGIEDNATADQTQADINGLAITTVGTITSGEWTGTAIADSYISSASTWDGKLGSSGNNTYTGTLTIDRNKTPSGLTSNIDAISVDYDRINTPSSGIDLNTGINIDMDLAGATSSGTQLATGIQSIITFSAHGGASVSGSAGSFICTGADAGKNIGISIQTEGVGPDIKIGSADTFSDYFTISTIEDGETTFTTVEDGVGSTAHMNFDADGDITLDAASGNITVKDDGGNYTPSSDYHIATKKYVDENDANTTYTKASFDLDHLYTLVGAASDDAEHLATFTGSTIADSQTIKQALQALETAVELRLTNNADDTMAGTLTIDKDYSVATSGTTKGLVVDLDRTGNVASGIDRVYGIQSLVDVSGGSNHVQLIYGIECQVDGDDMGSGESQTVGVSLEVGGTADTSIGINNKTVDGGIDYQQVSSADTGDYFRMVTTTHGATTLSTFDDDAAAAHLNIEADGHVEFDGCGVGFDLVTPTFNAADTNVDFKTGNKQMVTLTDNIADLNLTFPATSGNFTILLKQDGTGSRTMAADGWLAFEHDGTAATVPAVKFPGGTAPTLTTAANHVDIVSFFWDADNQVCYGVASLDFQD